MKIVVVVLLIVSIFLVNLTNANTIISDTGITTPNLFGGNISVWDLIVRSGSSIKLAGATFEYYNISAYGVDFTGLSVDQDFSVLMNRDGSSILSVVNENDSVNSNSVVALSNFDQRALNLFKFNSNHVLPDLGAITNTLGKLQIMGWKNTNDSLSGIQFGFIDELLFDQNLEVMGFGNETVVLEMFNDTVEIYTDLNVSGVYYGDGSQLTGISTGINYTHLSNFTDDLNHTIDTNRSNADILSVASVYNDTNWVLAQGYLTTDLWTNSSGNATFTSGNVGIGTTNPISTLHVNGSGAVIVGDFDSYASITETSFVFETGEDTSFVASHNGTERQKMEFHAKEYEFETGESDNRNYFVMDTDGKIGIGTTNPSSKLEVAGDVNISGVIYGNGSGLTGVANYEFGVNNFNGSGNVTTTGRVGIGTTTPTERLTIDVGENNFGGLEVTNSDTGTNAQSSLILRTVDNITAFGQDGTFGWLLTARKSNFATTDLQEDLLLSYRDGISWNNIMFIEHDTGNIGIGMPSPSTKLSVNGNAYMDGDLNISGNYYGDGSQLTGTGWSGYEIISVTTGSSSDNKAQSAYCSSGKNVTGGGCSISSTDTNLAIQDSFPRTGGEWRCRGVETDAVAASWALTVYAICGNV